MSSNSVADSSNSFFKKTRFAILWTSLLNEPLLSAYGLLAFIMRKDLDATAFQIALLTMLKPLVSVFSFYWSAGIAERKDKLRANVVNAGILARLPFLCFPFIDNPWFLIASAAIYMFFYRAGIPAWMEILKLNLPKAARERLFSLGSALGYAEGVILAVAIGTILDHSKDAWKMLFFVSTILGIIGVLMQNKVPIQGEEEDVGKEENLPFSKRVLEPWKASLDLMRTRPDFARFQWGFMACGFGIMLIQPALPLFFVDELHLSYTDLAIALSICKGLGFVFSSSFWAKGMSRIPICKLSSGVFMCVGLFPLCLALAIYSHIWLYLAYGLYGIAQAGSHLIWNLSGPIFSEKADSSQYSGVNIMMVGIRSLIAHPMGGVCCVIAGPFLVLFLGMFFCFCGGWVMLAKRPFRLKKAQMENSN